MAPPAPPLRRPLRTAKKIRLPGIGTEEGKLPSGPHKISANNLTSAKTLINTILPGKPFTGTAIHY